MARMIANGMPTEYLVRRSGNQAMKLGHRAHRDRVEVTEECICLRDLLRTPCPLWRKIMLRNKILRVRCTNSHEREQPKPTALNALEASWGQAAPPIRSSYSASLCRLSPALRRTRRNFRRRGCVARQSPAARAGRPCRCVRRPAGCRRRGRQRGRRRSRPP